MMVKTSRGTLQHNVESEWWWGPGISYRNLDFVISKESMQKNQHCSWIWNSGLLASGSNAVKWHDKGLKIEPSSMHNVDSFSVYW